MNKTNIPINKNISDSQDDQNLVSGQTVLGQKNTPWDQDLQQLTQASVPDVDTGQIQSSLSGKKESEPVFDDKQEKISLTEIKEPEPSGEVKDWLQKVETGDTTNLPKPVLDDYNQVLVQASVTNQPQVVIPLDDEEIKKGFHHKAVDSLRWLAEWCARVLKMTVKKNIAKANVNSTKQ